jgi:disulfide bond formation protein DsbB
MRARRRSARPWLAGIVVLCIAAVAAAAATQHLLGMQPCPWCVLQRLIFLAIALLALPGALLSAPAARLVSSVMVLVGALAGIGTALWQHFVAAASASCNLTLADRVMNATGLGERFPQVFAAYASCADAKVKLLGVPYEFWSLTLFVLIGLAAVKLTLRRR